MPPPKPTPDVGFRGPIKKDPAARPTITIPPPTAKGKSQGAAFNAFINGHPIMRAYADTIWKWSKVYGTDPVVMAALFWRESFAAATSQGKDPASITSPTGAGVGIGQINPKVHIGEKTPWGATINQSNIINPDFNIRWSTYYFSRQMSKYGNPNAAYNKGYNPGYTGADLTSLLPKGYVGRTGLSPTESASVSVETAAAKKAITDPWIVLTDKGKLKRVFSEQPPKNALKYGNAPLTESSFNTVWKQGYADTFFAYTGKPANAKQIVGILKNAPSVYTLSNTLAKQPGFVKSPTYKSHAPGITELAKSYYGNTWKADPKMIARAIAENWDQATLEAHLRARPEFLKGPVFQGQVAKMDSVYTGIYGNDPGRSTLVKEVALQGWSEDQLAAYLRAQPAYKTSGEYRAKALSFAKELGLITGDVPTLTGTGNVTTPVTGVPNSARIPGKATQVTAPNLKAGVASG